MVSSRTVALFGSVDVDVMSKNAPSRDLAVTPRNPSWRFFLSSNGASAFVSLPLSDPEHLETL